MIKSSAIKCGTFC